MTEQEAKYEESEMQERDVQLSYELAWRRHRLSEMIMIALLCSFLCGGAVSAMVYLVAISVMHGVSLPTYYFYIDIAALVILWIVITTCVMRITTLGGELLRKSQQASSIGVPAQRVQPASDTGALLQEIYRKPRPVNAEPRVRFVPHCDEYKVGEPCPICGAKEMGSLTATFCKDFACEEEAPHLHGDCQVCKGEFVTCLDVDYSTIDEEP